MIDDNDVDLAWVGALVAPGWLGLALTVVFIVLTYYAYENKAECAQMHCANGTAPVLQNHECQCVTRAQR